jgi:hypothetical protein
MPYKGVRLKAVELLGHSAGAGAGAVAGARTSLSFSAPTAAFVIDGVTGKSTCLDVDELYNPTVIGCLAYLPGGDAINCAM